MNDISRLESRQFKNSICLEQIVLEFNKLKNSYPLCIF